MLKAAKCWIPLAVTSLTTMTVLGSAQVQEAKPTPTPVAPALHLALTSLTPEASFPIAGTERQVAIAGDAVWVSNRAAGTLTRIDPKTNTAGEAIAIGKEPCYPTLSAFGSLWTPLCGAKALVRTEVPGKPAPAPAATPAATPAAKPETTDKPAGPKPPTLITLGIRSAGPVLSAASSIWMITDTAGILARIDPDTNAPVAEVVVPAGANAMTFGDGAIWVSSATKNSVTRVNADTNVVMETVTVGQGPVAVTTGAGSVWTLNGGDGTISRIDPKTNKVTQTIKAGVKATTGSIALGEGSLWVSAPGSPLIRIDPATNAIVQQFSGAGGGMLAVGHKSLWLTATPVAIWRIDPKRVDATRK